MPDPPRRPPRAAALSYSGEGAPKVVAAGQGHVAETILRRAREAGVPVREDSDLAETLASLALGSEIPEDLWIAVARVLAWAYALEERASARSS
jgi:flagellar biosynthesis protein